MMRKLSLVILILICLGPLAMPARSNDTELTYGGTPRPLKGNTTVSMLREYVKMVVGEKDVTVDCRFTFRNRGPARKVRMGFPDEGGDTDVSLDPQTGKHILPEPSIQRFQSWVNGKAVKTTAIPAEEAGSFWHVKRVAFPSNSTLDVRDRYTVPVGGSVAYWPHSVALASYVLHTGASWRGTIGRSVVEITFERKRMKAPLVARRLPNLEDHDRNAGFARTMRADGHAIYYRGPCAPVVTGKTLRFVRTHWRPGEKDDIYLVFDVSRLNTQAR